MIYRTYQNGVEIKSTNLNGCPIAIKAIDVRTGCFTDNVTFVDYRDHWAYTAWVPKSNMFIPEVKARNHVNSLVRKVRNMLNNSEVFFPEELAKFRTVVFSALCQHVFSKAEFHIAELGDDVLVTYKPDRSLFIVIPESLQADPDRMYTRLRIALMKKGVANAH